MSEEMPEKRKGGCFSSLATLFTLAMTVGLGAVVWFLYHPQDLSDVKGYGAAAKGQRAPDLVAILNKAESGVYPVTITEEQINLYLKEHLQLKQGGLLDSFVKLEDVVVRLTPERAEVVMVRSIFGRPFTTSMYIRVDTVRDVSGRTSKEVMRDGGDYFKDAPRLKRGGRFGQVEVPQGFLILVMPAFEKLATAMQPEIDASFRDMARVKLGKGNVLFDPREEGDTKPSGKF